MKRGIETLVYVVSFCVIAVCIWMVFFEARIQNQSSKQALIKIHEAVQLGHSHQQVIHIYEQFKTERTELEIQDAKNWKIGMPFELGASDWILCLQFVDGIALSAVKIRTSDGLSQAPPNSPDDKGVFVTPTLSQSADD